MPVRKLEALNLDDPYVAATLTAEALEIWNSPHGQTLVKRAHPKQKRLLASLFNDWAGLITLRTKQRQLLAQGENIYVSEMEGQGFVENPMVKVEAKMEKRMREAEVKLGITKKDLMAQPTNEDEAEDEGEEEKEEFE